MSQPDNLITTEAALAAALDRLVYLGSLPPTQDSTLEIVECKQRLAASLRAAWVKRDGALLGAAQTVRGYGSSRAHAGEGGITHAMAEIIAQDILRPSVDVRGVAELVAERDALRAAVATLRDFAHLAHAHLDTYGVASGGSLRENESQEAVFKAYHRVLAETAPKEPTP